MWSCVGSTVFGRTLGPYVTRIRALVGKKSIVENEISTIHWKTLEIIVGLAAIKTRGRTTTSENIRLVSQLNPRRMIYLLALSIHHNSSGLKSFE